MPEKVTVPRIRSMRDRREKIVCITAYDYVSGAIADASDVDLILVGDSVGNVVLGYESTLPVTLEEMLHHVKAVRRGVKRALLVADLPFGSYGGSILQAVESACALMKAGAEAVKLEGSYPEEIAAMVKAGIPVMGHVGMTPQSVNNFGGHRVQGKGDAGEDVLSAAQSVVEAGAFSVVLELVPASLASQITAKMPIATIGIGAGIGCDGQIQVFHDVVGLSEGTYKHAHRFVEGREVLLKGIKDYATCVRRQDFPTPEQSF